MTRMRLVFKFEKNYMISSASAPINKIFCPIECFNYFRRYQQSAKDKHYSEGLRS